MSRKAKAGVAPKKAAGKPRKKVTMPEFGNLNFGPSDKTNPKLGWEVHKHLEKAGIETPMEQRGDRRAALGRVHAHHHIKEGIRAAMDSLGLDMQDDSLIETPARIADMYVHELFVGLDYNRFPKCTAVDNKAGYNELVVVERIPVMSVCEHHFQTIDGYAWIAYIPGKKVLGLSKFARIVEFFSRRPQIQERLTLQIHGALQYILQTDDIGVFIKADHYCMKARGVSTPESATSSSKMSGKFMSTPALRSEFLNLTKIK